MWATICEWDWCGVPSGTGVGYHVSGTGVGYGIDKYMEQDWQLIT